MTVPRAKYGRAIAIVVLTVLLTAVLAVVLVLPIVGALRGIAQPEPPGTGLELRNVLSRLEGSSTVVVEGTVANVSSKTREVPQLRAVARNAARTDLKDWLLPPGISVLRPGETGNFLAELADMPRRA